MRTDDVETFAAHPAQVGRILFGGEFLRQLFRDDGVLGHALLLPLIALSLVTPAFVAGIHVFLAPPSLACALSSPIAELTTQRPSWMAVTVPPMKLVVPTKSATNLSFGCS